MKIVQIVAESDGYNEVHKLIRLQTSKLVNLSNQFNTVANHIGHERARAEVLNQLVDAQSTD